MQRRRTAAIAGAAAIAAFATTVGLGANLGLFGLAQPDSGAHPLDGAHGAAVLTAHEPSVPVADD